MISCVLQPQEHEVQTVADERDRLVRDLKDRLIFAEEGRTKGESELRSFRKKLEEAHKEIQRVWYLLRAVYCSRRVVYLRRSWCVPCIVIRLQCGEAIKAMQESEQQLSADYKIAEDALARRSSELNEYRQKSDQYLQQLNERDEKQAQERSVCAVTNVLAFVYEADPGLNIQQSLQAEMLKYKVELEALKAEKAKAVDYFQRMRTNTLTRDPDVPALIGANGRPTSRCVGMSKPLDSFLSRSLLAVCSDRLDNAVLALTTEGNVRRHVLQCEPN